jgi:hypothetical protein
MHLPTFLKAGSAALAVAGGVLAAVFVVIPAASASGQPANDRQAFRVHNLDSAKYGHVECDNWDLYARDNGPKPDAWTADCTVYSGHAYAVTVCEDRDGNQYAKYGDSQPRGSWKFAGECEYGGGGRYDVLIDEYAQAY